MPRLSAQLESDPVEQELIFLAYVIGAINDAEPEPGMLARIIKMASTHEELARFDRLIHVRDPQEQSALYVALLGELLMRCGTNVAERAQKRRMA